MYPYGAQHCAQLHLSPSPNIGLAGGRGDPDGDLNSPSSLRVSCPWNIDFYSLFKSDRNGPGLSSRRPEVLAYQPWHCNTLKVTRPPLFSSFVVASPVAGSSSYILQRAGCFPACDTKRQVFLFVLRRWKRACCSCEVKTSQHFPPHLRLYPE